MLKKEFRVKYLQNVIVRLLLLFYISASYLSAVHIHHDTTTLLHDDCKICIFVKNLSNGDAPSSKLLEDIPSQKQTIYSLYRATIKIPILKGFLSHAPPLFS